MSIIEISILILAVLALLSIILEEYTHINKAKTTLFFGCLSWVLLFVEAKRHQQTDEILHLLNENLLDISTLWLFLVSTMTFVAYLNARGLIGNMVGHIMPRQLTTRKLTLLLAVFALLLSMLCDNITATLVSLGVIQAFQLDNKERIKLSVLVVFAVNSGGVVLITGDVTTLMIFNAKHVSISDLLGLVLPTLCGVAVLAFSLCLRGNRPVVAEGNAQGFEPLDIIIAGLFFTTIIATMAFNILFDMPPVLVFLMGLSVMFMIGGVVNKYHSEVHLLEYVRQIQFDTLFFFLGILLVVGGLKEVGILDWVTGFYLSINPDISNYIVGVLSAILDNVPLTAALLKAEPELTNTQWLTLTYAVGVGGSLLLIGSAAGIIAMSRIKELTFISYGKYIPHLLVAYSAGFAMALQFI